MALPNNKLTIVVENPTCADANVENSDASYTNSIPSGGLLTLPDSQINVNGVDEGDIPSVGTIEIDLHDGTSPVTPVAVTITGRTVDIELTPTPQDIFIEALFSSGNDTMETLTITSTTAGTYTSTTNDGSSGTITFSINGGSFAAFSNPTTLVATDTLVIKRTTTTGAGWVRITGTY
jgi:hypothetical protein